MAMYRRNHIVPVSYLKLWIDRKRFYVYDKILDKYFYSTPRSIAVEVNLYEHDLEQHLASIEITYANVSRKLIVKKEVKYDYSVRIILELMVSLITRNPFKDSNPGVIDFCAKLSPDEMQNLSDNFLRRDSTLVNQLFNDYIYEILRISGKPFLTNDFPVCELKRDVIPGYEGLCMPLSPNTLLISKLRGDSKLPTDLTINDYTGPYDLSFIVNSMLVQSSTRHIVSNNESMLHDYTANLMQYKESP